MAPTHPVREAIVSAVPRLALSLEHAAEASGIRETLLYEAIASGQLRSKKWGHRTLVLMSDLEKFLGALPDRPVKPASQAEV
jgi:hypothetical protein